MKTKQILRKLKYLYKNISRSNQHRTNKFGIQFGYEYEFS